MDEMGVQGFELFPATYRLWNMQKRYLEPHCEDYGRALILKSILL